MNKRAAAQYLTTLFGSRAGHVAVAYKQQDSSAWQEQQFQWPAEKAKLMVWAESHQADNIFICPALREDGHTRKKGDMLPSQWLWADVDWQGVPADKREEVKARITELGTIVISSGTGDNVHVYVKLTTPVPHADFIKLNTGLRDYLYADAKQADNSLLRLPGTTNWKTKAGSQVKDTGRGNGQAVSKANLMKRRAFRDAKPAADAEASDWSYVEVPEVKSRLGRRLRMSPDEAKGRYGTRHDAVFAMVSDLYREQFNVDQIHSLMNEFPAAVDKMSDENGYDPHLDIDRCLARIQAVRDVAPDLSEEDQVTIAQSLDEMEPATTEDEEAERQALIQVEADKIRIRHAATRMAREQEAERTWVAPPASVSWSLTSALSNPPRPVPHLIEGLCGVKHNVVLTAQYKTGKTAFVAGSIAAALCDGHDFLDRFPVKAEGGLVVGHWNCEMDDYEMVDEYIRPVGIQNTDNLNVANLRGYQVDILTDQGRRWAVQWLRGEIADAAGNYPLPCKVWTIDSFARLARMAGVSEKDNDEVMSLLMALDRIKVEAEVDVLFLITHTGRAEMEEGKERARGATAIDDWADARWIMTKMDKTRFLRVEGRGVSLDDTSLVYDEETKRSTAGYGGKEEVREGAAIDAVKKIVLEQPGIGKTALLTALKAIGISNRAAVEPIDEAIEGGFIEVREEKRRGRSAVMHYPAGSLQGTDRTMKATARDVDLRGVGVRTRRRARE